MVDKIREAFEDYNAGVINGIISWLVHKQIATEEQLTSLRDGSYLSLLPAEVLRPKPKPYRTGLGDGSTWPVGLRLPRADEYYSRLFGVPVSKLDRLIKADEQPGDYETVAQLRARKEKALADCYVPSDEELRESKAAVDAALNPIAEELRARRSPLSKDSRVTFLLTLEDRIDILLQNWDEPSLRERLRQQDNLFERLASLRDDRPTRFMRSLLLYRIASLTREGEWLRGYKSGLSKHLYRDRDESPQEIMASALKHSVGVLNKIHNEEGRDQWKAGLRQGISDGGLPPLAAKD